MSREFAITTPAPTVSLDSKGRGEISFTVSNTTGQAMRARASLAPSPELKPEWLRLRGTPLRDMPPGSTEVFIVDIKVPPGTRLGAPIFRLVVADNFLPDERFSEGPAISVEMGAPAPAPARGFPWWLVVLGAVLVAGGAVAAFFALRDGEPACPEGQTLCAGECIDLRTDASHCGQCGTECGQDQRCEDGTCQCEEGLALCDGACVGLETSDAHCGRCGNACGEDFDCSAGQCVRTGCSGGQTLCGDQCVDTETDPRNCGACGKACDSDLLCRNGRCVCPGTLRLCSGQCVDTRTDEQHCGGCNKRCGSNQLCRNGLCQCTGGLKACGTQCVDTRTDERNCGSCGRRCGSGQQCQGGSCRCPSGQSLCSGACVNLQTSEKHCGRCGNACSANFVCRQGTCERKVIPGCGANEIFCPCTGTCLPKGICAKRCQIDVDPL